MKRLLFYFLIIATLGLNVNAEPVTLVNAKNLLSQESSLYLKMHQDNPVHWVPWGEEQFKRAQKENKLVIVSIGYAACHWCHVMEEESFSDPDVAALMNKHFVSIKVDREERPDVDGVFIEMAHLMVGQAGWPLNIILFPDKSPIYAATYLPKEKWGQVLKSVVAHKNQNPDKLKQMGIEVLVKQQGLHYYSKNNLKLKLSPDHLLETAHHIQSGLDDKYGGFIGAPKFIMPHAYDYMMTVGYFLRKEALLKKVQFSLDKIALSGTFDQLGGGFHRYATDEAWVVPHFEKMLYDNAQLLSTYAFASKIYQSPLYDSIIDKTIHFLLEELRRPEGGFYSSVDADSEGEEGKYYTFTASEFDKAAGRHKKLLTEYFDVTEFGDMEGGQNVLNIPQNLAAFSKLRQQSLLQVSQIINSGEKALKKARDKRVKPITDTKIISSWNGLLLSGFADVYHHTQNKMALKEAEALFNFLKDKMLSSDATVFRVYDGKQAKGAGVLSDYANLIKGFLDYYQLSLDTKALSLAKAMSDKVIENFYDDQSGFFFYDNDKDPALRLRRIELHDNVIPASNAVMAENLRLLGHFYLDKSYQDMAVQLLKNVKKDIIRGTTAYSRWAQFMFNMTIPSYTIAIVGVDAAKLRDQFLEVELPPATFVGAKEASKIPYLAYKTQEGKTLIYLCQDSQCQSPVESVEAMLIQLKKSL